MLSPLKTVPFSRSKLSGPVSSTEEHFIWCEQDDVYQRKIIKIYYLIKGIFHCQLDQGYASRIENYPAGEMINTDEKILSWSSRDQTDRTKAKDHYDIRK